MKAICEATFDNFKRLYQLEEEDYQLFFGDAGIEGVDFDYQLPFRDQVLPPQQDPDKQQKLQRPIVVPQPDKGDNHSQARPIVVPQPDKGDNHSQARPIVVPQPDKGDNDSQAHPIVAPGGVPFGKEVQLFMDRMSATLSENEQMKEQILLLEAAVKAMEVEDAEQRAEFKETKKRLMEDLEKERAKNRELIIRQQEEFKKKDKRILNVRDDLTREVNELRRELENIKEAQITSRQAQGAGQALHTWMTECMKKMPQLPNKE